MHSVISNDSGSGERRPRSYSLILAFAVRACPEGTVSLGAPRIELNEKKENNTHDNKNHSVTNLKVLKKRTSS